MAEAEDTCELQARQSSSAEYVNEAFEGDDKGRAGSKSSLNGGMGASQTSLPDDAGSAQAGTSAKSNPFNAARKSSIADIALALSGSRSGSTIDLHSGAGKMSAAAFLAQIRQSQHEYKYVHPYGNASTILEELLYAEDEQGSGSDSTKVVQHSPTKLLIWIVFCGFMVGVAGAIILGAESFNGNTSGAGNMTTPFFSPTTLKPG